MEEDVKRWTVLCYDCTRAWPAMTRVEAADAAADHLQAEGHRPRLIAP